MSAKKRPAIPRNCLFYITQKVAFDCPNFISNRLTRLRPIVFGILTALEVLWIGVWSNVNFGPGSYSLSANILLITTADDTFRKLLLESQGYRVETASTEAAHSVVAKGQFHLALLSTDGGAQATIPLSKKLKEVSPATRIAVIAQRAEYVPPSESVEAIIREQHSPGRFLAAVKKLVDGDRDRLFSATEGE